VLESLKNMNLKTVRAYNIGLTLQEFWKIEDRETAELFLKKWYFWATHCRLQPMIKKAKSIKKHWDGIMNYFDSKITNGLLEGLNSIYSINKPLDCISKFSKLFWIIVKISESSCLSLIIRPRRSE
jgi:transposase